MLQIKLDVATEEVRAISSEDSAGFRGECSL